MMHRRMLLCLFFNKNDMDENCKQKSSVVGAVCIGLIMNSNTTVSLSAILK